jgi:hypothetical protein
MLYGTPGARHHAERSKHASHTVQQLHWKREPGLQSGLSGNRSRQRRSHLHLRIKLHPVSGRKCRLLAHCATTEHRSNSAANERRIPTVTPHCSRSVPYSSSCSHRAFAGYRGFLRCCSQCSLSAWLDAGGAQQVPGAGQLCHSHPPQRAQPPETASSPSHRRTREES